MNQYDYKFYERQLWVEVALRYLSNEVRNILDPTLSDPALLLFEIKKDLRFYDYY